MITIDNNLLDQIGLGDLPEDEKGVMLKQIYETLEMRVGMTLAAQMSEDQLDEFEEVAEKNDDKLALVWLEKNFPDYKTTVAEELEKLKLEIQSDSKALLDASK